MDEEVTEMKKVFWALGLTMVFNVAGFAQSQKKSPEAVDAPDSRTAKQNRSKSKGGAPVLTSATTIQGQLQSSLDTRNAKVGDQVVLKTTNTIKQDGQTVVPKGTNLIGRVTEVQQRTKNGAVSKIGLVFDRLEGREISTPITASILSMTNVQTANSVSDVFDSDISGSSSTSARSSSRSSSGGGLLGGVTNTVGGVVNTTTQTVGGITDTTTRTLGNTTQTVGSTVNGIQISQSVSGSAQGSTTLSTPNRNLRLEKGVLFNLQVEKTGGN